MQEQQKKPQGSKRGRRFWRLSSMIVGALILLGGGLATMNLVAGQADGAPSQNEAEAQGAENDVTENSEGTADAEADDAQTPIPVEVTAVEPGSVSSYISSTANLVAEFEVMVLAEVEGRVLTLRVDEGDPVREGQILATLVSDDHQIRLKKAELKQANAEMAHQRGKDLADKDLISREDYDKLTVDLGIAEQELAEARWALERTTIRAPFSGRITQRVTQAGQHLRIGDSLFQVTDFEPLIARIYLPERDVLGLETGRQVHLRLNADEEVRFPGMIRQISPIVDMATGTVKVTIEAHPGGVAVRPGSFVTIDIVRDTRHAALLLPREAVMRELQRTHVFVAEDNVARKRSVTLGLEEGDVVEALSGLDQGERVIVAGQGGLKDGSRIKVLESAVQKG